LAEAQRRLTTIVAADIAGFSRLVGDDEEATLAAQRAHRTELIEPLLAEHHGRVVNTAGDSFLFEFPSAVEAVRCAIEVQKGMTERNRDIPEDRRIKFRIGINVGDVLDDGEDLLGDGVNVAARLEGLAEPGGICISRTARDNVRDRMDIGLEDLGEVEVKNISRPVRVFRLLLEGQSVSPSPQIGAQKWIPIVTVVVLLTVLVASGSLWWAHSGGYSISEIDKANTQSTIAESSTPSIAMPRGPKIIVLPFANWSGDSTQEYLADGITDEVIVALTRYKELFVLSRGTSFQFKEKQSDAQSLNKRFGVQYLIEGGVRRSAEQVRVTVNLIEAQTAKSIWSDVYDRNFDGLFELQSEVAKAIVGKLAGQYGVLAQAVTKARRGTTDVTAYDLVLRSMAWWSSLAPEAHAKALDLLEQAIKLDPDYSLARAHLANAYTNEFVFDFNRRPDPLKRALEQAQRAAELDPTDAFAHYQLARIYAFSRQLDAFEKEAMITFELNPNLDFALADLGHQMMMSAGKWELGLGWVQKAKKLNPLHPGWYHFADFYDAFRFKRYKQAAQAAEKINMPYSHLYHMAIATSYGMLGNKSRATKAAKELLKLKPNFVDQYWAIKRKWFGPWAWSDGFLHRYAEGLRQAGLDIVDEPQPTN
jgi:adenylate cyclase